MTDSTQVFTNYAPTIHKQSSLRQAITKAYRRSEKECLPPLLEAAKMDAALKPKIAQTAKQLIETLRRKHKGIGVEALVQEYALSSQEGVALMCLAEALLRIPDKATRDALIRDKIADGDWKSHLNSDKSLFVNAATWGLFVTGKLTSTVNSSRLSSSLSRLIARCGEPVIRKGVDMAMRMMGEQFVRGETIEEAISRSKPLEERGFRYSYDMLGEAATTKEDALRYYKDYEHAIHAIGHASNGRGIIQGPSISIKLSALHPRYFRSQADRVMHELLKSVKSLAKIAKDYNIGLNIDAEEADRLELSLDLMEELCLDKELANWNGLGFVVQAYGRRASFVLDYLIDLARRSKRRLMIRLVKGAYWDAEIKRAQLEGLEDFPVFTRKVYTDVSYIANARKLLQASDAVFAQFATHNAQTMASIYHMASMYHVDDTYPSTCHRDDVKNFHNEQFEFQCLHGMGEPLYDEVVGKDKLQRPVRIYAPVGTHETLLAYLVRRLLENGANSSFVHQIADKSIAVDNMIADPVDSVIAMHDMGALHEKIALPEDIFAEGRKNSQGYDLSNEDTLQELSKQFLDSAKHQRIAISTGIRAKGNYRKIINPSDCRDYVGNVYEVDAQTAKNMIQKSADSLADFAKFTVKMRSDILEKAANLYQENMPRFLELLAREAGKSIPNAIAEVREAIDFLRYYAKEGRTSLGQNNESLGVVVCISPWNFPLAIFTGQIAAALMAGNVVLAKPAEETPLIAFEAVALLHKAGILQNALQLVLGDGEIGAALVAHDKVSAILFTGSTEVARLIQKQVAKRLSPKGRPVVLIAETGGQNAMIVDSSALAEQVVGDVIASAFDSAGQRCSALRVLCLQEEVSERILTMLKGALQELRMGRTDSIGVDIGAVISLKAKQKIDDYIVMMQKRSHKILQLPLGDEAEYGTFVAPTLIEIDTIADLSGEVFGPVLHVLRYKRQNMEQLIDDINASGYGLTFGLHTRLDETIAHVTKRIAVGNIYINRNVIGAVVGLQPFGGRGLSGTGPKAGGPLYLSRLVDTQIQPNLPSVVDIDKGVLAMGQGVIEFVEWLLSNNKNEDAIFTQNCAENALLGLNIELQGVVGEENRYALRPRGRILLFPKTEMGLYRQMACCLVTGNTMFIVASGCLQNLCKNLPESLKKRVVFADTSQSVEHYGPYAGCLIEGEGERIIDIQTQIANFMGPLILTQAASTHMVETMQSPYNLHFLVEEVSISTNLAAAGGNASLMMIG